MLLNLATLLRARVVTYDVKGAFLNAKFKKDDPPIYLVIRRDVAELWVLLDPSAKPFVTERGELILCLDRYIYGMMNAYSQRRLSTASLACPRMWMTSCKSVP
jgi:hypothetical protein